MRGQEAAIAPSRHAATVPPFARWLGYAGLLPQIAVVAVLLTQRIEWRFTALALGYAYAALILSFLGGLWWGLAARSGGEARPWVWLAAVAPSLIALASAVPWATGAEWPAPSLGWLGLALIGSLAVDGAMARSGFCPRGWMALRVPLSVGLGLLTWIAACL